MTDKLIGCVQHDCDKCKERESSCNEAHRLAQLRFERIAELEAEVARLTSDLKIATIGFNHHRTEREEAEEEIALLKAQEPVAWLISSKDWWPESVAVTQKPTGLLGNETLQPLYLASGAAPAQENT